MSAGLEGFAMATFQREKPFKTEIPNLMLVLKDKMPSVTFDMYEIDQSIKIHQ